METPPATERRTTSPMNRPRPCRISSGIHKVALGFASEARLFSKGIYVAVEGTSELIRDKTASAALDDRPRQVVRQWGGYGRYRPDQDQRESHDLLERSRRR